MKVGGGELKVAFRPDGFLNLSAERLRSLGWRAEFDLVEMYKRTAKGILGNL